MLDIIRDSLRERISDALGPEAAAQAHFGMVPADHYGDISLVTIPLAKLLRESPVAIAARLAEVLREDSMVAAIEPVGPYLNIALAKEAVCSSLSSAVASGEQFAPRDGVGQRALLEHTSINPNASPHVGRCRNAIIGDTLARIMRHLGFRVDVHYYVNDMGK